MTAEQKKILVVDDEPDILQLLEISLTRMGFSVYKAENLGSAKYQLSKTTFITKPISLDTLRQLVVTGLQQNDELDDGKETKGIGISIDYFESLDSAINKYSQSQVPVIIYGKHGSWKEKIADLINENSGFKNKKLTFVDCSNPIDGLRPENIGTLLYQNVEQLKPEQQTVLIKFIKSLSDQQRVIVTTNWTEEEFKHSLGIKKSLVRAICVGEIETKPLIDLKEDLIEICKCRLEQLAEVWNKLPCKIHPTAIAKLKQHNFPGNMKELDLVLSKAAVNCQNQLIREEDIQLENTGFQPQLNQDMNLEKYIEEIEKREITNALTKTDNNKTKAAELLGISFRALRYKIKKLDID